MTQHNRRIFALLVLSLLVIGGGVAAATHSGRDALSLLSCKIRWSPTDRSECVFLKIQDTLRTSGIAPAVDLFVRASALFPGGLDVDCHAGIHRVGDMVYYDLIIGDPDISHYAFPPEARMCNRGFFHGIFEHLFQDHPDPAFIVKTCDFFKNAEDPEENIIGETCYHAAGHGLFRRQAETLSEKEWGNPNAFVLPAVAVCNALPGANERERYTCTTGVESLFIQASLFRNYGLSDPSPLHSFALCDELPTSLHASCYFVQALMVVEFDKGYGRIIDQCLFAKDDIFDACVQGSIVGLFTNGVDERSFNQGLDLCADSRVSLHHATDMCYERLAAQLTLEYKGPFTYSCSAFPEAYRASCLLSSSPATQ